MSLENTIGTGVRTSYGPRKSQPIKAGQVPTLNNIHAGNLSVAKVFKANRTVLSASNPAPLDLIDNVIYGHFNYILYKSTDEGTTWVKVKDFGSTGGELKRVIRLATGKLVILSQTCIYKYDPDYNSIETVIKLTEGNFAEWGIDTDGTNVIIVDYGVPHTGSNYMWISNDCLETFIRLEKNTLFPGDDANTHFHGVAIDPHDGKFWLNMGDATYKRTYFSLDNGTSWTEIPPGNNVNGTNIQATTISVFPDGLILGSDSGENNGLFSILRKKSDSDLCVDVIWRWPHPEVSVRGFPFKNFYDKTTGITFTCWRSDVTTSAPMITWSNGYTGGILYEYEGTFSANDGIRNIVVLPSGKVLSWVSLAGVDDEVLEIEKFNLSTTDVSVLDTGNTLGGVVTGNTSGTAIGSNSNAIQQTVAVGADSDATATASISIGWSSTSGINSTTIGTNADGTGRDSVVIGYTATTDAKDNIVIGSQSTSAFDDSILVGRLITNSGTQNVVLSGKPVLTNNGYRQVVIGWLAESAGYQNVVIGRIAKGTGNTGTAIGNAASAGTTGVALGAGAVAILNDNDVAIGNNTTTTLTDSVAIGVRDLHVQDATKGVVLTSPNGTKYRITVNDAGTLATTTI